jgi:ribosomal protein S18 acetylase RimI-like enzyme
MASMTVTLRRMTPAEFDTLINASFADFFAKLVAAGQFNQEDVPAEIQKRLAEMLPDGPDTELNLLFIGEVDGERIGWLWLTLPGTKLHPDTAWVHNVTVDETHRGKGYGRGLMLAAEQELVRRGVTTLGLNVFGSNATAIRLYERLGYEVVSQQMSKALDTARGEAEGA